MRKHKHNHRRESPTTLQRHHQRVPSALQPFRSDASPDGFASYSVSDSTSRSRSRSALDPQASRNTDNSDYYNRQKKLNRERQGPGFGSDTPRLALQSSTDRCVQLLRRAGALHRARVDGAGQPARVRTPIAGTGGALVWLQRHEMVLVANTNSQYWHFLDQCSWTLRCRTSSSSPCVLASSLSISTIASRPLWSISTVTGKRRTRKKGIPDGF